MLYQLHHSPNCAKDSMTSSQSNLFADPSSPLDYAVSKRDADVIKMVRDAVAHDQAIMAFQPVVQATEFDHVAFHEGLIRILDNAGRIINARDFMHVVEDSELGRKIDTLALNLGCQALADVPSLRLAVNMSARSIGYSAWQQTLDAWLQDDPSIGERLILEITESSTMRVPELVIDFMDRLQMRGICFALDGFGAGYTALRYFKEFFFDILKIDGEFIRGIANDPDNRVLAKAMLTIGKQFDMVVVAEMVEDASDAEVLQQIGFDCLQGYHFGAPTVRPHWMPSQTSRLKSFL